MEFTNIILEKEDNIATITFNRPPMNPISIDLVKDVNAAINNIKEDHSTRVVIITGAGDRAFAAGADVNVFKGANPERMRELARVGQQLSRELEDLGLPVIAAINGFALGGGVELAMACDIRLASDTARLGQPEVGLGITPGYGGTQRLPRLVGKGMAKLLIFTGDMIDAQEALRIGLVQRVVPQAELLGEAKALAGKLATMPPLTLAAGKEAINRGLEVDLERGLSIESLEFGILRSTEDYQEGTSAFLEKRKASFKGK